MSASLSRRRTATSHAPPVPGAGVQPTQDVLPGPASRHQPSPASNCQQSGRAWQPHFCARISRGYRFTPFSWSCLGAYSPPDLPPRLPLPGFLPIRQYRLSSIQWTPRRSIVPSERCRRRSTGTTPGTAAHDPRPVRGGNPRTPRAGRSPQCALSADAMALLVPMRGAPKNSPREQAHRMWVMAPSGALVEEMSR